MTKDIELKAIDELIYEVEMFEQAGVYPIHDFIDNLKTLVAKVKEETKLEVAWWCLLSRQKQCIKHTQGIQLRQCQHLAKLDTKQCQKQQGVGNE